MMHRSHIENIRKTAKKRGVKPTTTIIKTAIAFHCPDNQDIALKLPDIIESVVSFCEEGQLAFDDSGIIHQEPSQTGEVTHEAITQFPDAPSSITEETEKAMPSATIEDGIARSLHELGNNFRQEDMHDIRQLAYQLSRDVSDTTSLVNSLITAYLQKRNSVLSEALTQLERGRKAQNEEMYGGLDSDFFCQQEKEWQQFGSELLGLFN
jgi:hypothetical protein